METKQTVEERVRADLEAELGRDGFDGVSVVDLVPFGDGHSGITYELGLAGPAPVDRAILRLSPPGVRIAGPSDVGRQGRIMAALDREGLPVPAVLASASNPAVDGRSFALVDFVAGEDWVQAASRRSHRHVASRAVEVLRRIHAVKIEATGLDEEPRTPAKELGRWQKLIARSPAELQVASAPLLEALAREAPQPSRPALVHGDFHYGNLVFSNGQVVAVVDWEIAHLGEPLLDLGCLAVATMRARYSPEPNPTGSVAIPLGELVDSYGADRGTAAWFIAVTALKYAAIIGYNLELARAGKLDDPIYEQLQTTMLGLVDDAFHLLEDGIDAN
ncbi:MAG TPA: phosphotransferase family protein [Solirubrobacterales bacterium]